jgi:hypothetical protein
MKPSCPTIRLTLNSKSHTPFIEKDGGRVLGLTGTVSSKRTSNGSFNVFQGISSS